MTAPFAKQREGFISPRTEALVKMWERGNERDRSMMGQMHQHYEGEVRRMVYDGEVPHNIAHTLHGLIDDSVNHTLKHDPNGRKVRCTRGCAACCSLHVHITRAEADLLIGHAANEDMALDWARVERQAQHDLGTWHELLPADRRCVFLGDDEACRVYEHRPAACRKYMVITSPKLCDTVRFPGAEVGVLASAEAEVVTSAMLAVLKAGDMSRLLLAALDHAAEGGAT